MLITLPPSKARPQHTSPQMTTPLFRAARKNSKKATDMAADLLTSPDICCLSCRVKLLDTQEPKTWDTAAHVAAKLGNASMLKALLYAGADFLIKNKAGKDVYDVVGETRNEACWRVMHRFRPSRDRCRQVKVSSEDARALLALEDIRDGLTVPSDVERITDLLEECYETRGILYPAFRDKISLSEFRASGKTMPRHKLNCFIAVVK